MNEKYCNKCGQCHPDTSAGCPPIEKPINVSFLQERIAILEAENKRLRDVCILAENYIDWHGKDKKSEMVVDELRKVLKGESGE